MVHAINTQNATTAMIQLYSDLRANGEKVKVTRHGQTFDTLELLNYSISIEEPIDRIIRHPIFKQQPYWLASECITELLCLNPSLTSLVTKAPIARQIFDEMTRVSGLHQYTYGQRFAEYHVFEKALEKLQEENSRQAIYMIYNNQDLYEWSIPCTILHQFFKRNGKLHLTVYYRSNDAFRGFRNDVYFSSVILELTACWTEAEIGSLTMHFGSIHMYEEDLPKLDISPAELPKDSQTNYKPITNLSIKQFYDSLRAVYHSIMKADRYPIITSIPLLNKWREAIWLYQNNLPAPMVFY